MLPESWLLSRYSILHVATARVANTPQRNRFTASRNAGDREQRTNRSEVRLRSEDGMLPESWLLFRYSTLYVTKAHLVTTTGIGKRSSQQNRLTLASSDYSASTECCPTAGYQLNTSPCQQHIARSETGADTTLEMERTAARRVQQQRSYVSAVKTLILSGMVPTRFLAGSVSDNLSNSPR